METQNSTQEQSDIRKAKRFARFAYATLGLAALTLLLIFFWEGQVSPLVINNAPVPVSPTAVTTEKYVTLKYDYCKNGNQVGTVVSSLVSDKTQLALPTVEDRGVKGCHTVELPYPVPPQTVKDTYHYHFKVTYQVNPLKSAFTEWDSQSFVVEGSGGASRPE